MAYGKITGENVYKSAGFPSPEDMEFVMQVLLNKSFSECLESLQTLRTTKRFALSDILTELVKKLQDVVFPPKADAYLYKELAELEWLCWCEMTRRYRLTAGTQEDIQLAALVSVFIKLRGMIAWRVCCRCVV